MPIATNTPTSRGPRLGLGTMIAWSTSAAVRAWRVLIPVGIAAFFLVPFVLANVRETLASGVLPGDALLLPVSLPSDRVTGLVLAAVFTLLTYGLGALGAGAACAAQWPSIAGNLDRPTLRSTWIDMRPRYRALARTGLVIGLGVFVLQSVSSLLASAVGGDQVDVTDAAQYVRSLSTGELTVQVLINALAAAGVLFLLVRWFLTVPVVLFEGLSGAQALNRSRQLVAGNGWRVLALLLVIGVFREASRLGQTLVEIAPKATREGNAFAVLDEAMRFLPAVVDMVAITLLALWMGAAYTQLMSVVREPETDG